MRHIEKLGGEEPVGHSAQYITLARALGLALQSVETELTEIESRGHSISVASLQIEARFVTIIILSASICESFANTILAENLEPDKFKIAEGISTPKKWEHKIPEVLDCPPFVSAPVLGDLKTLFEIRNSIMHSKAKVFGKNQTIHEGNAEKWDCLQDPSFVRRLAAVPVKLSEAVPFNSKNNAFMIAHGVREYVLIRALQHEPKAFNSKA